MQNATPPLRNNLTGMTYCVIANIGICKMHLLLSLFPDNLNLNLNLNSLLVKRQIDNPSPGAVTGGN